MGYPWRSVSALDRGPIEPLRAIPGNLEDAVGLLRQRMGSGGPGDRLVSSILSICIVDGWTSIYSSPSFQPSLTGWSTTVTRVPIGTF